MVAVFTIPAVLSQKAAPVLDADDEDIGVTTRNLIGHVLAPLQIKIIPDMTACMMFASSGEGASTSRGLPCAAYHVGR